MNKKGIGKIHFAIIFIFLIGILLGFMFGLSRNKSPAADDTNSFLLKENSELKGQLEKAKKYFPIMPEMYSVSGAVKSINGNILTIETGENPNPFENLPTTREVTVAQFARIVRQEEKSREVFQIEMDEYQKKLESGISGITPPLPTTEIEIKIDEIKVNDIITAVSDRNIKSSASFEAVKIILHLGI